MTKENDNLDFDQAKDLTVGEAVRKDAEIQAGVTEEDNILDKYIKQHRDEVASQKFETREFHREELDTATLDDFIQKQRQELEVDSEVVSAVSLETEETAAPQPEIAVSEELVADETVHPEEDSILRDSEDLSEKPLYKKPLAILLTLLLLVLGIFGIGYGVNHFNQGTKSSVSSSTSSSSEKNLDASGKSKSAQAIKDNKQFNKLYAGFFTDEKASTLKNSEFGKLSELESLLKALEGTKFYTAAKEKYDSLKEQVDGIQAVNAKFGEPVIVDGALVDSAKPKADANFDDLSVAVLNTGNASLDNLLQKAVKKGRDELKGVQSSSASAAEASRQTSVADSESAAQASQTESQSVPAEQGNQTAAPVTPAVPIYGISNYDVSTLQRHLSRVPYNDAAIADSGNPAWQFAPGVLETVVAKAQARGNIEGNNYILERVNIINGNGYYNMFKPDGTYLFSINAKTGYFVGNKPGNADSLDY